jgi:integrase
MDNHTLLYEDTKKLPEVFTKTDINKLVVTIETSEDYLHNVWGDWMRARDKALMMTIYALALRPKEACKLKFEDFDLRAMTVHIHGENNKTGKDRVLPIPNELGKHLRDYLDPEYTEYLDISFEKVDGKEVCLIKAKPSAKPVFMKENQNKEFYIRSGNTSKRLDSKETHNYIKLHW